MYMARPTNEIFCKNKHMMNKIENMLIQQEKQVMIVLNVFCYSELFHIWY